MIDPRWKTTVIDDFGGARPALDASDIRIPHAQIAKNVEFFTGQVATRRGYGPVISPALAILAIYNWLSSLGSYLAVYASASGTKLLKVSDGTTDAFSSTATGAAGAVYADAGARVYCAFFNSGGAGSMQGRVISFQSAAFVEDKLFPPPLTYTPAAPTEPGAGGITAGVHRLGYIIEFRNGALTAISPVSAGGIFQPVSFTASGSKNAQWSINTTTWPASAVKFYVAMTTVDNPNQYYFVPNTGTTVTFGAQTVTFDITDADLAAILGTSDANPYLNLLTQAVAGTGPFNPSVCVELGDRMGYVTTINDNVGNAEGALYISDKNEYQRIAADLNLIQLPGFKQIVTAKKMTTGIIYIFGPHWTYRTRDNGESPIEWHTPEPVDLTKGTLSPRGVEVSSTGLFCWVVSEAGLYTLDLGYSKLPVSYFQTNDWNRINWAAAATIQVRDNASKQRVQVLVPLDAAATPSHIMTFDYQNGYSYQQIRYSLDSLASYPLGALAIVENSKAGAVTASAKHLETWLGSTDSTKPILRQVTDADTTPYRDNGGAISWQYRTAPVPTVTGGNNRHVAMHLRAKGSGSLAIAGKSLDGATSVTVAAQTLSVTPDFPYFARFYFLSESMAWDFSQNAVDSYAVITELTHYWLSFVQHRN